MSGGVQPRTENEKLKRNRWACETQKQPKIREVSPLIVVGVCDVRH